METRIKVKKKKGFDSILIPKGREGNRGERLGRGHVRFWVGGQEFGKIALITWKH